LHKQLYPRVLVLRITYTSSEGLTKPDNTPVTFTTWSAAEQQAREWANRVDGIYAKVGFTVYWADETATEGRLYLRAKDANEPRPLAACLSETLALQAGIRCPAWMREAEYEQYVRKQGGNRAQWAVLYDHRQFADS